MLLLVLYLALALVVSFLCSIAEAVILSVTPTFVSMKESENKGNNKYLRRLKNNIERPLSAILTVNTVAHTVGAAGVGAQAVAVFGEVYFGLISAVLTFLILFFSEIIPKTIGATYWRKLAIPSSVLIMGMIYLSYPIVIVSEYITRIISRNKKSATTSREEIIALVQLGTKDGALKESESRIIDNLIKVQALSVRDIMTPRTVVVSASADLSLENFAAQDTYQHHSRIPLYSESIDNVTGYVLKSDVLEEIAKGNSDKALKDLSRTITIFYENLSIPKLLEELLVKKEHIALIIDEYGGMQGLATMEDIIETILGLEIMDEKDTAKSMQELAKQKWEIRKKKLNIDDNNS